MIVIGPLEMNGGAGLAIHALGAGFVVFRVSHALCIKADAVGGMGRTSGAAGTAPVMVVASVWTIVAFF